MSLMQVLLRHWRKQGLLAFVYLDDILVLGQSPEIGHQTLPDDGDRFGKKWFINKLGKIFFPSHSAGNTSGFSSQLEGGKARSAPPKLKSIRKELGKLVTHPTISCRKMATILGQVRSFLQALPFLRAFTDLMVKFVDQHTHQGWDKQLFVPP
jgi:hypothetical protein